MSSLIGFHLIGGKFNREGKKIKIMHIAEVLNHDVDESRVPQLARV